MGAPMAPRPRKATLEVMVPPYAQETLVFTTNSPLPPSAVYIESPPKYMLDARR